MYSCNSVQSNIGRLTGWFYGMSTLVGLFNGKISPFFFTSDYTVSCMNNDNHSNMKQS